jgi:hypothetical protein
MSTPIPITIAVTKVRCIEQTDGFFLEDDEPYVIVFAADLTTFPPSAEATLYGPWADVDSGDLLQTIPLAAVPNLTDAQMDAIPLPWRRPCWGLNRLPTVIERPDDVVILAAVLENDNATPNSVRALVKAAMIGALVGFDGIVLDRTAFVARLINDMNGALDGTAATGGIDFDERIGSTKELRLTAKDLAKVATGPVVKTLQYFGEGAHYRVAFELVRG